jgi:hypothetical protein
VPAVGLPGIVAAGASVTEPAALEQRADDVAAVPQHVEGQRLGIGAERAREHVARLGILLDSPQPAHEREAAHTLDDPPHLACLILVLQSCEARHRRLEERHLAEVDPAGLRA